MNLREAMTQYKAQNTDELYGSCDNSYIVCFTGAKDVSGATFLVLHLVKDIWHTGEIWLAYRSHAAHIANVIEIFANRTLTQLENRLTALHGQDWADWNIYTAEQFEALCRSLEI